MFIKITHSPLLENIFMEFKVIQDKAWIYLSPSSNNSIKSMKV